MFVSIPLFEHTKLNFSEITDTVVSEKFLNDNNFVLNIEHFLERNNLDNVISFDRAHIKPTHYVGVIKYKNIQFEILPKLLGKNDSREQILKNLLYMLSYTKQLDIKDNEVANITSCPNPFIETLIRVFANRLFDALKRFIPKNYEICEENTSAFKGKLKIAENIRYNLANKAKFFCEFDSFTEDTELNQLFLYVATRLQSVSQDAHNKKILKFIINIYSDISFKHFTKHDLKRIRLNRSQQVFAQPFNLAKMFLEHSSVDMSKHQFDNIALIWDMNLLFEEFVFEFLKRNCESIGIYDVQYQKGRRLLESTDNQHYYANTFVDMFVKKEKKKPGIVIDTKYKLKSGDRGDFDNADIFQVVTYCKLHNSGKAILLYPATDETVQEKHRYKLNVDEDTKKKNTTEKDVYVTTAQINLQQDLKTADLIGTFQTILDIKKKQEKM